MDIQYVKTPDIRKTDMELDIENRVQDLNGKSGFLVYFFYNTVGIRFNLLTVVFK